MRRRLPAIAAALALSLLAPAAYLASRADTTFAVPINNFSSALATAHTSGSGTLILTAGTGTNLGTLAAGRIYRVTAVRHAGQNNESVLGIFEATGRTVDTLTGVTAAEGYSDRDLPVGTSIQVRVTAKTLSELQAAVNALEAGSAVAGDVAAALALKVTAAGGDASATVATPAGASTARTLAARLGDTTDVADFGAVGDGTTDDTTAIAAAITAARAGGSVRFVPGKTYLISSTLALSKALTFIGYGATLHQGTGNRGGIATTASGLTVLGLTLAGPQHASQVAAEAAISAIGASAASPITGLRVEGCTISNWGMYGVYASFTNDVQVRGNRISDVWYAGVGIVSGIRGTVASNTISDIPGTPNGYGLFLSRASTASLVTDPRTSDYTVTGNQVTNVTYWEGIDTHGGQRITVAGNTVKSCFKGIAITTSTDGVGNAYVAPLDVTVADNAIDSGRTDGSADVGIIFNGVGSAVGTMTEGATGTIAGNSIRGHGLSTVATGGAVILHDTAGLTVSGNALFQPSPYGINFYHDNYGFTCTGNTIVDPWTAAAGVGEAVAIYCTSGYNVGATAANTSSLGGKSAAYLLTSHLRVANSAGNALRHTAGYTDSATPLNDAGSKVGPSLLQPIQVGTAAPTTNELGALRRDTNAAVQYYVSNQANGSGSSARVSALASGAGGYFGAWSAANSSAYRAGRLSLSLNSDAAGITLDAPTAGQDIKMNAGSTTNVVTVSSTGLAVAGALSGTTVAGDGSGLTALTKSQVGLANVDNTADASKPVSTATQTALDLKAPLASPTFTGTPAAPTASTATNTTQVATTAYVQAQSYLTTTGNGSGLTGLTKSQVGLGSVDNTADTAKPVSTAQQTALDLKADLASPTFTGTPAAPTPSTADNTTKVATTAYVQAQSYLTTTGTGTGLTALNGSNVTSGTVAQARLPSPGTTTGTFADGGTLTTATTNIATNTSSITGLTNDPPGLGIVFSAPPHYVSTASAPPNSLRVFYMRIMGGGGVTISKIRVNIGTSSGNLSVGVYTNSGSGLSAVPASRRAYFSGASPGTGARDLALTSDGSTPVSITVARGEWLAVVADNTTITLARMGSVTLAATEFMAGFAASEVVGALPVPTNATPTNGYYWHPMMVGVP